MKTQNYTRFNINFYFKNSSHILLVDAATGENEIFIIVIMLYEPNQIHQC
ncbi:Uncharacterised protein [Orientia tsutsugamushi]|nr:Uncharacterised protein [Orientia tsutsugamushi]